MTDLHDGYEKRLDALIDDFNRKTYLLAEEYSDQVIGPFCRKHKLCFVSGMGEFSFFRKTGKKTGEPIMVWELQDPRHYGLRFCQTAIDEMLRIYEVLHKEIGDIQIFGYFCPDQNR